MYISDLKLVNFRNYAREKISFSPGINIFLGKNAQGKTNLLEAVYYCSRGNSFKSISDSDIIRNGENRATLDAQIIKNTRRKLIHMEICSQKVAYVNNSKIESFKEMKDHFDIVYFWPDHLRILKDGPHYRREVIDQAIITLKPTYKKILARYNKILFQRNSHIKKNQASKYFNDQLKVINKQLADVGSRIILLRRDYIEILNGVLNKYHEMLVQGKEKVTISYQNSLGIDKEDDSKLEEIRQGLYDRIKQGEAEDRKKGYTTIGPHRDDLLVYLGDLDTKLFASQGQQRSIILSLKLAEIDIVRFYNDSSPILLLDDVFSELDQERRRNFLACLKNTQSIITSNDIDRETVRANEGDIQIREIVEGKINTCI